MFQTNHNPVDLSILDRSPGALSFHLPLHRLATDLPPQALAGTLPKKTWENTQNLPGKDGNTWENPGKTWEHYDEKMVIEHKEIQKHEN